MDTDNSRLATALVDYRRHEACWANLFAAVKNVVKSGCVTDGTRATLKSWLKGSDLTLQMLSMTVS